MVAMPKASASNADDEAKYLVIHQPYPAGAHWELDGDKRRLVFWLASCVGPDPILGLYHRPKSMSMVIVEVLREYEHFDRILGEHRWDEFLRQPKADEKGRSSKVYFSTYSNYIDLKKDGWKRAHIESSWFDEWAPVNSIIADPYPATSWCDVPKEPATGKIVCRPLPVSLKPRPVPLVMPVEKPREVPGAAWASGQPGPSANQGSGGGKKRNKKKPTLSPDTPILSNNRISPTIPGSAKASQPFTPVQGARAAGPNALSRSPPTPASSTSTYSSAGTSTRISPITPASPIISGPAWTRGPPSHSASSPVNNKPAWSAGPPGLTRPATAAKPPSPTSAWGPRAAAPHLKAKTHETEEAPATYFSPPGLTLLPKQSAPASVVSAPNGRSAHGHYVSHPPNPAGASRPENLVRQMGDKTLTLTDAYDTDDGASDSEVDELYAKAAVDRKTVAMLREEYDVAQNLLVAYIAPHERNEGGGSPGVGEGEGEGERAELPRWDQPANDEIVCTEHGKICPRGICKVYKSLWYNRKRAQEREQLDSLRKERNKARKKAAAKREKGSEGQRNDRKDGSKQEEDEEDEEEEEKEEGGRRSRDFASGNRYDRRSQPAPRQEKVWVAPSAPRRAAEPSRSAWSSPAPFPAKPPALQGAWASQERTGSKATATATRVATASRKTTTTTGDGNRATTATTTTTITSTAKITTTNRKTAASAARSRSPGPRPQATTTTTTRTTAGTSKAEAKPQAQTGARSWADYEEDDDGLDYF